MAKILTLNFYLDKVQLCDQYYNNKTNQLVPEEGIFFKRKECYNPLFFDHLNTLIKDYQPDILLIATQNESKDSYFHSDFLKKYIKNYTLLTYKKNEKN